MNPSRSHDKHDLIDAPDFSPRAGSGRAAWDERGNSIWEWQTAPGVFTREVSSQQLHALASNQLSLEEAQHEAAAAKPWSRDLHGRLSGRVMRRADPGALMAIKPGTLESLLRRMRLVP